MTKKKQTDDSCADCGQADRIWMARQNLWDRYSRGAKRLCILCFEKRLGRSISRLDLMGDVPPCNFDLMLKPRREWNVREWDHLIEHALTRKGIVTVAIIPIK